MSAAAPSRLRRLAARAPAPSSAPAEGAGESCELCAAAIPAEHRHLVDLEERRLLCACRPCSLLFDRPGAGAGRYRAVPERSRRLEGFVLDDAAWASLRIPVDLAFFLRSSRSGRVAAVYPSPLGATESLLELDTWTDLERANPVLQELEPDVEALLVNRAGSRNEHYLVPIDECYALAGILRVHWRGLAGGGEVWREIDAFFDRLRMQAR